jgi:3-deoxy-D-manno-octulosonic-acid transferase
MIADLFLIVYCLVLFPKLFLRKKLRLFERLIAPPPSPEKGPTLWIHAVSVGEVKAAEPLFKALRKKYPHHFFLITTTTSTGQEVAKQVLLGADAYHFLPLDFSWRVKKWVKQLRPEFFFLIESDIWPNLLTQLRKVNTQTFLISGKLSEKSFQRYSFFPSLSKKLFSLFDLICAQNEEHKNRFLPFVSDPSRLHVTGNLKFDGEPAFVDIPFWTQKLTLPPKTVLLASTHLTEEELILNQFPLETHFLVIAPRHPERFHEVAQLLTNKKIPFFRWSELDKREGIERALLVDSMGQLPILYSLIPLAIVGGSYTDKVGGHNILEPSLYGSFVFFGPHMFRQKELVSYVLTHRLGTEVSLAKLNSHIHSFFHSSQRAPSHQSRSKSVNKILGLIEERAKSLNINH